jgi:Holliday junction resolvase-like predicted endonuclease
MAGEPLSAPSRAHLGRLGYRLLEDHFNRRTRARLLIVRSHFARELVFCELRAERVGDRARPRDSQARRRLRRAAFAWLAAQPAVDAQTLRFDRLTVFVGHDGAPVGLEHEPQAF